MPLWPDVPIPPHYSRYLPDACVEFGCLQGSEQQDVSLAAYQKLDWYDACTPAVCVPKGPEDSWLYNAVETCKLRTIYLGIPMRPPDEADPCEGEDRMCEYRVDLVGQSYHDGICLPTNKCKSTVGFYPRSAGLVAKARRFDPEVSDLTLPEPIRGKLLPGAQQRMSLPKSASPACGRRQTCCANVMSVTLRKRNIAQKMRRSSDRTQTESECFEESDGAWPKMEQCLDEDHVLYIQRAAGLEIGSDAFQAKFLGHVFQVGLKHGSYPPKFVSLRASGSMEMIEGNTEIPFFAQTNARPSELVQNMPERLYDVQNKLERLDKNIKTKTLKNQEKEAVKKAVIVLGPASSGKTTVLANLVSTLKLGFPLMTRDGADARDVSIVWDRCAPRDHLPVHKLLDLFTPSDWPNGPNDVTSISMKMGYHRDRVLEFTKVMKDAGSVFQSGQDDPDSEHMRLLLPTVHSRIDFFRLLAEPFKKGILPDDDQFRTAFGRTRNVPAAKRLGFY